MKRVNELSTVRMDNYEMNIFFNMFVVPIKVGFFVFNFSKNFNKFWSLYNLSFFLLVSHNF